MATTSTITTLLHGRLLLTLSLLLASPAGYPDRALHPLADIRTTAEAFVLTRLGDRGADTTATAGRLDPRLRLARCQQPLEAFAVAGDRLSGNTSIGVQCPGGWRLYVPVKVETLRQVLALKRSLERGSILTADDLESVLVDTGRLVQGYYTDIAAITGYTLIRSAASGTLLTHALVEQPPVIERGQRVALIAGGSGIAVQAPGEALASARIGERLRVKNLSSGKVLEGVARGPGSVEVH